MPDFDKMWNKQCTGWAGTLPKKQVKLAMKLVKIVVYFL